LKKKKEQTKKHGIAYKIKQKDITYTLLKKKIHNRNIREPIHRKIFNNNNNNNNNIENTVFQDFRKKYLVEINRL